MFWENFLRLCEAKNTSPTAVCLELGLSNAASTRWKKGSIPQGKTLQKLSEYFGVTSEALLKDNDSNFMNCGIFIGDRSGISNNNTVITNNSQETLTINDDIVEVCKILRELSPRKRHELIGIIYNFADENLK